MLASGPEARQSSAGTTDFGVSDEDRRAMMAGKVADAYAADAYAAEASADILMNGVLRGVGRSV